MDVRLWVALAWVVMIAALILWLGNRNSNSSSPGVDVKHGPTADTFSSVTAGPHAGHNAKIGLPGNVVVDLVWMVPGTFLMGSPATEAGHIADEGPQTSVTLSKGFWLGRTEVTQQQWQSTMGNNPSNFTSAGLDAPVENVSWDEAMAFCQKITDLERAAGRLPTGYRYTLPTEAEWEYASRAGSAKPNAGVLDAMAWFTLNSGNTTHSVGTKQPNAWGLCDMYGNVWEWCADWSGKYPGVAATDPTGPAAGTKRVARGGAWNSGRPRSRSATRLFDVPGTRSYSLGFRLALCAGP